MHRTYEIQRAMKLALAAMKQTPDYEKLCCSTPNPLTTYT